MTARFPPLLCIDHSQERTIVALNNAGVILLEKGHASQALQVLQDLHFGQTRSASTMTLEEQLRRAVAWTQQPSNDVLVMDVHVLDDGDSLTLRDAVLYGPSSSMVFGLRLNKSRSVSSSSYYSAVTLFNYGMACRCRYTEMNDVTLLQQARQALVYATLQSHETAWLAALIDCALERVVQEQQRHEPQEKYSCAVASNSSSLSTSCHSQSQLA